MTQLDTDILIVGAGLAGAATAFHLARGGIKRVVVVEQEPVPGVHSSGRNAAIVREHVDDSTLQPLITAGAASLRRGRLAAFERRGLMLLGAGDHDVRPHFPFARGTGRWCPDDGTVDVAGLLQAYLTDQEVCYNTRVLGWEPLGDALRVNTTCGPILCRLVVNAAGPWAGEVGDLPLTPMNRHLLVTTPIDWVDPSWPCVWDTTHGLYFRPESGGLLLCCCDEAPGKAGEYHEDRAVLERLAGMLSTHQPDLGSLSVASMWVGQRTFAADRRFVIGFDPRDERVFHVAGLGGHGVTASFAVGDLAARLIRGARDEHATLFAPARLLTPPPAPAPFSVSVS